MNEFVIFLLLIFNPETGSTDIGIQPVATLAECQQLVSLAEQQAYIRGLTEGPDYRAACISTEAVAMNGV